MTFRIEMDAEVADDNAAPEIHQAMADCRELDGVITLPDGSTVNFRAQVCGSSLEPLS